MYTYYERKWKGDNVINKNVIFVLRRMALRIAFVKFGRHCSRADEENILVINYGEAHGLSSWRDNGCEVVSYGVKGRQVRFVPMFVSSITPLTKTAINRPDCRAARQ